MKHYEKCYIEQRSSKLQDRTEHTTQLFNGTAEIKKTVDMQMGLGTLVALRTRWDILWSQYMMLRSEDRRRAELPDIFCVDAPGERPSGESVKIMLLVLHKGKVMLLLIIDLTHVLDNQGRHDPAWSHLSK